MTDFDALAAALKSELCTHKTLDDGTGVVLDLRSSRVLALNATGMFLVEEIAQRAGSIEALIEALVTNFQVDRSTAETDVRELLDQLGRHLTQSTPAAP